MNKREKPPSQLVAASRLHVRKPQSHPPTKYVWCTMAARAEGHPYASFSLLLLRPAPSLPGPTDVTLPVRVVPTERKRPRSVDSSCVPFPYADRETRLLRLQDLPATVHHTATK